MVFIRKSAGRSGATEVRLAERRGGRDHVLEHVGAARSDVGFAVLMAEAGRRLRPGQAALDLDGLGDDDAEGVPQRPGVITGKRSAVLWQVLSGVYDRLGFDVVGNDAFRQLVPARIIEPTSKADSLRVLDEIGVEHASLRTMFRSLRRVGSGEYRSQTATACFTHACTNGDVSLCPYDVTTLHFEAENEDEPRKVGYSKEHRVDPQIVVGRLVDLAGSPFEIGKLIDTITPRVATEASVAINDTAKKVEPVWDPAVHTRSSRAVWAYSRERATPDGHTLTLQENRAEAVVAGDEAAGTPRTVTTKNGTRSLGEGVPAGRPEGVRHRHPRRPDARDAGPVQPPRPQACLSLIPDEQAHPTIVFAAPAITRHLQDATRLSIKKIVRPLQQIHLRIVGHDHVAEDPLTPAATSILHALTQGPH